MNIENIHVMRDSFRRLFALCRSIHGDEANHWFSALEATRWLEHIKALLIAANVCAALVHHESVPLLIHCSDGWDRTAQLCALTQILLDPYFRTRKGFAVLVEKEFCAFGHRFEQRLGQVYPPFSHNLLICFLLKDNIMFVFCYL